jgi:hypothetical protein
VASGHRPRHKDQRHCKIVRGHRCGSLFLLFAFVKALHDRRASWYQRGFVSKPLRKISVILLHDITLPLAPMSAALEGKVSAFVTATVGNPWTSGAIRKAIGPYGLSHLAFVSLIPARVLGATVARW